MTIEEMRAFWEAVDPSGDYERCIFDGPREHGVSRLCSELGGAPEGPLFDLGCGVGRLTVPVAWLLDRNVIGLDISSRMIAAARARVASERIAYRQSDGATLPIRDEAMAGGWSVLLFQHLPIEAVALYLVEIARALMPGGRFVAQLAYDREGSEGEQAQNHDPRDVAAWLDDAGLVPAEGQEWAFAPDGLYPTWLWVTAAKP